MKTAVVALIAGATAQTMSGPGYQAQSRQTKH